MKRKAKVAGVGTGMQSAIAAAEIRAGVRGRLERAARAEAKREAAERMRGLRDRFPAVMAKATAAELEEGKAMLAEDWTATIAGWTRERMRVEVEAAVEGMGLEGAAAAQGRLEGECFWKEARARVAWGEYVREMYGAQFEAAMYDLTTIHGGEARGPLATILYPAREAAEAECERVLRGATRNAMLEMKEAMAKQAKKQAEEARTRHAEAMQGLGAVAAGMRSAERAALLAAATAKGKAEVGANAADLVETFKEFDKALGDEEGPQIEIARGVIADAKEAGRFLGGGGVRNFLKWWRGWGKRGRPDARQYAEIHEREGRWPE